MTTIKLSRRQTESTQAAFNRGRLLAGEVPAIGGRTEIGCLVQCHALPLSSSLSFLGGEEDGRVGVPPLPYVDGVEGYRPASLRCAETSIWAGGSR
jgi:hypothetical protein